MDLYKGSVVYMLRIFFISIFFPHLFKSWVKYLLETYTLHAFFGDDSMQNKEPVFVMTTKSKYIIVC